MYASISKSCAVADYKISLEVPLAEKVEGKWFNATNEGNEGWLFVSQLQFLK